MRRWRTLRPAPCSTPHRSDSPLAQTLTIGVRGGPDSIDPHFTATGTHAEALKHVFDTLTWSGNGLEVEPRLAESWKPINADHLGVQARKGVKFHDGSDFTAEDVKFSIERIPVVAGPNPTTIYVRRVSGHEDRRSAHDPDHDQRPGAGAAQRLHPPVHRLVARRPPG